MQNYWLVALLSEGGQSVTTFFFLIENVVITFNKENKHKKKSDNQHMQG